MKTKYKGGRILALLLLMIAVLLCMSAPASAVTYVDGSSNSYTPGSGTTLSGNNYNVHFTSGAIVGYRFSLISKNSSGSYYQVKATDVFYSGSNTYPVSPYTNHLKITAGGTVYRNLSKFAYNNLYSSITKVEAEAYSNSSYSKYTGNASSLGTTITDSAESMKTWCKTASKMNLVLAKFGSYTMANLKDSDRIFVEPLYGLRINGTGYCITVTEMALLGRIFYGDSSTGYEGAGKGYDWLTICEYTNRYYASEMYTSDSSHCGISVGSALSSRATFYNIFAKGYGLYVVRCENPHTLTVYYRTGTGASSLTIGTGYKLASNFSSYSSSYIRNSSDNYYTQSVKYDNTLTLSSGFGMQRDYYTFSHWKDIDSTNTFASGAAKTASQLKFAVSTGDATLTLDAIWKPVNYTITYNLNGGKIGTSTTNPTQSYTYETNVYIGNFTSGATAYTVPTKTGYVFAGWKNIGTDIGYWESGTVYENKYNKGQYEHGNITLTAQWTPISYTVKYYLDGTEQTSLAQTCKYGTNYTYKTLPTKTGYAVSGWNSNSAMTGTAYTAGAAFNNLTTTNGGTVSRYAKLTANSYTVKYYLDGVEQTSLAQTCTYDTLYYYAALPAKTGYVISGWNANADMSGLSYSSGASFRNLSSANNGNVKRYAKSVPITYQVKYNGNGSTSGSMTNSSHTYNVSKALTANAYKREFTVTFNYNGNGTANTSSKATAVFNGWSKSSTGSVSYADKQSVINLTSTDKAVVNVYAKWTDGSVTLPSPTRTGYILSGWYTASSGGTKIGDGGDSYTPSADITVYARWTPITYTIKFDGNGSTSGSTASMNMTYDVAAKLTENGFVRSGYEFVNWNTKADGTGTTYNDMQTVKNLTAVQSKVITLYAVWKPVRVLSLEPVIPNAAYREGTDVITSFYIVNAGLADCVPGDNVSVKFTVYKGSTAIKTLTMNNVVVPKNDKNLLYFKWTVPALSGSTVKITGEIIENGENYGLVSRAYATCTNVISATPDTQYEASAPVGFTAPSKLTEKSETVNWSVWIYENNAFVKKTYGYGLKNVTAAITPDPDSHSTLTGTTWTMKSGYGYSLSASGSGTAASGYLTPDSTAYTSIQYAYALFPEFGYSSSVNSFRTLELSSGKWIFRTNGNYGRIHFTPLWYPDGNYTASVVLSDCWTPAGMITAVKNANTVNISGSAYDDWFID